jgi:hypothetical protein
MPRRDWRRFRESRWNGLPALCLKLLYNSSFFSANSGKQKRLPVSFATRLDSSVQFNPAVKYSSLMRDEPKNGDSYGENSVS